MLRACTAGTIISLILTVDATAQEDMSVEDRCGAVPYTVENAELSVTSSNSIAITFIDSLAKSFDEDADQDSDEVGVNVELRIGRAAAGGYAASAFTAVARNYFCRLEHHHRGNNDVVDQIRDYRRAYMGLIGTAFNSRYWDESGDFTDRDDRVVARRRQVYNLLDDQLSELDGVSGIDAINALPSGQFTFDRVRVVESNLEINVPGAIESDTCLGLVNRSLQQVPGPLLDQLQLEASNIRDFVSGDPGLALDTLWVFAQSYFDPYMNATLHLTEQVQITPEFLTCLEESESALRADGYEPIGDESDEAEQLNDNDSAAEPTSDAEQP